MKCLLYMQPDYNYRATIKTTVPQLKTLDDQPLLERSLTEEDGKGPSVFEEDWKLISEFLQDGTLEDSQESLETAGRYKGN